jgi:SSS family solute:Na+ symporter
VVIGLLWIPVIQGSKGLYDYLQSVQGYLAPPIFVVFFLGIFWKRLNAAGCLAALIVGFGLGLFRLAVDTPTKIWGPDYYAEGSFLWIVNKIYFQYFSLLIFLVSVAVMVVVSYVTRAPDYQRISGLTFGTLTPEHREASRRSWGAIDIVASVALMAAIIAAYSYFRG